MVSQGRATERPCFESAATTRGSRGRGNLRQHAKRHRESKPSLASAMVARRRWKVAKENGKQRRTNPRPNSEPTKRATSERVRAKSSVEIQQADATAGEPFVEKDGDQTPFPTSRPSTIPCASKNSSSSKLKANTQTRSMTARAVTFFEARREAKKRKSPACWLKCQQRAHRTVEVLSILRTV